MEKKGFSFKAKMVFFSCFCSAIAALVGTVCFYQSNLAKDAYSKMVAIELPKFKLSADMVSSYHRANAAVLTLGIPGLSSADGEEAARKAQSAFDEYSKLQNIYADLGYVPGQHETYEKANAKWSEFKAVSSEIISLFKSGKAADLSKVHAMLTIEFPVKANAYSKAAGVWYDYHDLALKTKEKGAAEAASASFGLVILVILSGVFIGLAVGYIFAQRISRSIGLLAESLGEGADEVSSSAATIASSSQGLSSSATEQASSLEETVATMEELTAMVRQNTDNAKQAASLASSTREIAMKGEREIKTLIDSINSISADSKKIEEITTVIDDIAFQTNLLALNAAVEAARAGEQGKGFAVVAEAVRSLAQRSSLAAKDIAELIKNSVEKIEIGSKQASQGGAVLGEIVNSVKKVADLNNEISNASDEQNAGILQISQAMSQLDQITQSNAASSEETASSAEKLFSQSKALSSSVTALEHVITGGGNHHVGDITIKSKVSINSSSKVKPSGILKSGSRGSGNVLEMKDHKLSKKSAASASAAVIPFDDGHNGGMGKVGTTDGF